MKFKTLFSICLTAGISMSAFAQTHVEGIEYFKADQLQNAKELLERNYNNAGTDKALANYYLGCIAFSDKDFATAKKYFDEGIKINPENGYNYVGLGSIALQNNDEKAAKTYFKDAEKYAKKDAQLYIDIANAYYDANPVDYAKEIAKYDQKARRADEKSPAIYLFEGNMSRDQGNISEAASLYNMAINFNPQATGAYVKYANLYKKVNPKERINQLTNLLAANPNSAIGQKELAEAYYDYAEDLSAQGSSQSAAAQYKKASDSYRQYVNNPNHFKKDEDRYALLLFSDGDYKEGYDYATELLKANPGNFTAKRFQFFNAAQLPELKDNLLDMAEALYATHKANPEVNKIGTIDYNLISDVFSENGKADEAVDLLEDGLKEFPTATYFLKAIAAAHVELRQFDKAAEAYARYLSGNDNATYAENLTGALYSYFGGIEDATNNPERATMLYNQGIGMAKAASEKNPDQYRPYKVLGDFDKQLAADENAAKKAAVDNYLKAAALYEANPDPNRRTDIIEIYNYLGNYYLDSKDIPTAKSYFLKVVDLQPEDAAYRKFVESLK